MLSVSLHNPTKCTVTHYFHKGEARAAITFSSKEGGEISIYTSPDTADALHSAWLSLAYCETCKKQVEAVNEADECGDCHEARIRRDYAKWRPVYEGETKTRDELNADLRAAGRGHLIGDTP